MENHPTLIRILFILTLLYPAGVFGYEPNTTHDGLTHEAVDFYNAFAPSYQAPIIRLEEKALIQKGAMQEDDSFRMAHHFFDPIYQRGLEFPLSLAPYMSSKIWAQSSAYQASWKNGPAGCLPQPQLLFPLYESPCDFSWQRAIYEYVYGDKNTAMLALGHTLHLIEDASVPDHTRNDAHIPIFDDAIKLYDERFVQKSPFEEFTNQFSLHNKNITTTAQLVNEKAVPYKYSSLDTFFDNAASYSNTNFFSNDTIFDSAYSYPIIEDTETRTLSNGTILNFGKYNGHLLVRIEAKLLRDGEEYKIFSISDSDKLILNSYWQLTSRDAVKNAAGVIRLFFEEVEKEKQTHALQKAKGALVQQASTRVVWGIAVAGETGARGVTKSIAWIGSIGATTAKYIARGISASASQIAQSRSSAVRTTAVASPSVPIIAVLNGPTPPAGVTFDRVIRVPIETTRNSHDVLSTLIEKLTRAKVELVKIALAKNTAGVTSDLLPAGEVLGAATVLSVQDYTFSVGGGGGGGVADTTTQNQSSGKGSGASSSSATTSATATSTITLAASSTPTIIPVIPDTTPPPAPIIITPSSFATPFTTNTIQFEGTAASSTQVSAIFSASTTLVLLTDVDSVGRWSLLLNDLPFGTSTIQFLASDDMGNVSSSTEVTLVITPSYQHSTIIGDLTISGDVVWNKAGSPYIVNSLNIPLGTSLTILPGTVVKFNVEFAWVNVYGKLIIGEHATSEKVFLTSISDDSIAGDTNNDNTGTIPTAGFWNGINMLSGTSTIVNTEMRYGGKSESGQVIAQGTAHVTLDNVLLAHAGTHALSQTGGSLTVNNSTIDHVAKGIVSNGGTLTMEGNTFEHISLAAADVDLAHVTFINNGGNSGEGGILLTGNISGNLVLPPDGISYVGNSPQVLLGGSLTILPGGIMKFSQYGWLNVYGNLTIGASGGATTYLTSLTDDSIGGDTNRDGGATVPPFNNWNGINMLSGTSTLANVEMRYGGLSGSGDLVVQGTAFFMADNVTHL